MEEAGNQGVEEEEEEEKEEEQEEEDNEGMEEPKEGIRQDVRCALL